MKKRIIISDVVDPRAVEVLQNEGYEVRYIPNINTVELKEMVRGYNGLIVRSDTKVTADIIAEMDQMEVIGRAGSGITNIDVEAATRKGIVVMNTPGGNTISTAEHTMSLLLSMCRNIPQADHSMKDGKWERKKYRGMEIHGKTLGIFGLGKVGKEVAARALGFGMIVIGYDPILSEDIAAKLGIRLVEIAEVFKQSDIITVHVPLDERTANLIRKETLALCKPGVKIINCARGGIINEEAMLEALNSGHVSAAAIDVYQTEPPDFTQPLFSHPSVVTTPHLCSSTDEAEGKVSIQIAEQFIELFNNNKIIGAVNSTAIAVYNNPELAPFVLLAEKLGILIAQLIKGKIQKIAIVLEGELLNTSDGLISTAVLKGFLEKFLREPVNLVNAPVIAREAGITFEEIKTVPNPHYTNLLTIEYVSDQDERSISATVFGSDELRIVQIDQYQLKIIPEGNMLFYLNIDRPGTIAAISKILADAYINIGGLSLGRLGPGKETLTIISIDYPLDEKIMKKIRAVQGIGDVRLVKV